MPIQQEWLQYCANVLMPFGEELTAVDLGLLRHAFFCGASSTYGACSYAGRVGSSVETLNAIRQELEFFMQERSDVSIALH